MNTSNLQLDYVTKVIEACLLTANVAITLPQLVDLFDNQISESEIKKIIINLIEKYTESGIELISTNNGYRFRSCPQFQHYINKLNQIKPPKYSRSIMETLAIIAYKQPVTRGEIEEIRGVTVNSNIIQTLTDRGWIEIIGYKQIPVKPELLATTKKLLEDLGIESIENLPNSNAQKSLLSEVQYG